MSFPEYFVPDAENDTEDLQDSKFPDYFVPDKEEPKAGMLKGYQPRTQEDLSELPWWERVGALAATGAVQQQAGNVAAAKGLASGVTLGATENITALQPAKGEEEAFSLAKIAGEFAPIEGISSLYSKGLGKVVSPIASRLAPKAINYLAELTASGLSGGTVKAVEELSKGNLPKQSDILEHGATWAAMHAILSGAGQLTRFTSKLLGMSGKTNKAPWEAVKEISKHLEESNVDIAKIDEASKFIFDDLNKMESNFENLTSKKFDNMVREPPPEVKIQPTKAPQITKKGILSSEGELQKKASEKQLFKIALEPYNVQALTTIVQSGIADKFGEAESAYTKLYDKVKPISEKIKVNPKKTIDTVNEVISYIESLKTRPEGYDKVLKTAKNALEDLGVHDLATSKGAVPFSKYTENITLSKSQELARRLNKVTNYDLEGPPIKKQINKIVGSLKDENMSLLKGKDKRAAKNLEKAEKQFGETAEKFGKDNVSKIRNLKSLEKGLTTIVEPTTVKDLRNVLPERDFKSVEREVVKKIQDLKHKEALNYYREVQPYLSPKSRTIAEDIIKGKKAQSPLVEKTNKLKEGIIGELQTAQLTGKPPKDTLNLWKTKQGRKVVKKSLEDQKANKEILEYLNQQAFHDFTSGLIAPNGQVNIKAVEEFTSNPEFISLAKELGGEEAGNFIKSLDETLSKINTNAKSVDAEILKQKAILEKLPKPKKAEYGKAKITKRAEKIQEAKDKARRAEMPYVSKAEDIYKTLGVSGKIMVYASGVTGFGIVKGASAYVISRGIYKAITNPTVRKAWRQAAERGINPINFMQAMRIIDNSLQGSEKKQASGS